MIVNFLEPLIMVLAEQLMLVMFGGLAANIFGEIDGFNQKGVIL